MDTESVLRHFASLPQTMRRELADRYAYEAGVSAEEFQGFLSYHWPFFARPAQLEPPGEWTYWVILSGRGYGKTRSGAEWIRSSVRSGRFQYVNLIGATADDARDIMIEGESGILKVCPKWERPEYQPSRRQLSWPNGCKSLIFTADEPERLRGKQHQRLWADELAAWRYEESWHQAMLGLRLGPDPRALVTTTPKPKAILRDLLERPRLVVTRGTTYENRDNLAPEFFDEIIRKYEGTRLGRQELEAELLLDEGLAYRVLTGVHVVPSFKIPDHWQRFEAMDYGRNHPTAWPLFVVDHEGNVIVTDMYYGPGMIAEHARAILSRRTKWYPHGADGAVCYAPADIRNSYGFTDPKGKEITVETEFAEHGISFGQAQQDRRAGYARIEGLLAQREGWAFPDWHPLKGQDGSPGLFFLDTEPLEEMVQQLRDAPLEDPNAPASRFPGEAVDQDWESDNGHAHAALRYGVMSRPSPSDRPTRVYEDERREAVRAAYEQERAQWEQLELERLEYA